MCHCSVLDFIGSSITVDDAKDKAILEIGSLDVNGSARDHVESLAPSRYVGIDLLSGTGVDIICDAHNMINIFGEGSFDMIICTEVLEHVKDWRSIIHNIKGVCSQGGNILITARSKGFGYHAFPEDYWRFTCDDMRTLFSDCSIVSLMDDPHTPGVFIKVKKPNNFNERDLRDIFPHRIEPVNIKQLSDVEAYNYILRQRKVVTNQLWEEIIPSMMLMRNYLPRIEVIVEIGSGHGGTMALLTKMLNENGLAISIEPDEKLLNVDFIREIAGPTEFIHIWGKSTDPEVERRLADFLGGRRIDILFIDGDHRHQIVKHDYITYRKYINIPGIVAFHDIALDVEITAHRGEDMVANYWNSVAKKCVHYTETCFMPERHCYGIGMVYL